MAKIAISITLLLLCRLACHPPLSVSMQDATDSPCRRRNTQTHRCKHNPHVFIKPPHPLSLSLSLTHTQNTCTERKCSPVTLFVTISTSFPPRAHLCAAASFTLCRVFRFLKPPKSENTHTSVMLGNLVNRPERGGEAACLSACLPDPWLLLCTAHSLSPQGLLKPSPHRSLGGTVCQEVRKGK